MRKQDFYRYTGEPDNQRDREILSVVGQEFSRHPHAGRKAIAGATGRRSAWPWVVAAASVFLVAWALSLCSQHGPDAGSKVGQVGHDGADEAAAPGIETVNPTTGDANQVIILLRSIGKSARQSPRVRIFFIGALKSESDSVRQSASAWAKHVYPDWPSDPELSQAIADQEDR